MGGLFLERLEGSGITDCWVFSLLLLQPGMDIPPEAWE